MNQIAKLFTNGRSQAVRLPKAFRFDGSEVYIRKDSKTGDVILSPTVMDWDSFFALVRSTDETEDFLLDRNDGPAQERDLY